MTARTGRATGRRVTVTRWSAVRTVITVSTKAVTSLKIVTGRRNLQRIFSPDAFQSDMVTRR
jgi:hypothetical protein